MAKKKAKKEIKYRVKTYQPYDIYEKCHLCDIAQLKAVAIKYIIKHHPTFMKIHKDFQNGKINIFKYRAHKEVFDKAMYEANPWLDEL